MFSVSPGLDFTFSSSSDISQLLEKFEQLKKFRCVSFAILFDDINASPNEHNRLEFESPAHAQAYLANYLLEKLGPLKYFMFCPTGKVLYKKCFFIRNKNLILEYCGSFARPSAYDSPYLLDLGNLLNSEIMIMWTG